MTPFHVLGFKERPGRRLRRRTRSSNSRTVWFVALVANLVVAQMIRDFFAGIRRWWLRRFRGIVEPPRQFGGRGTTWQEWPEWRETFGCPCGFLGEFTQDTYVIRSQEHVEGCEGVLDRSTGAPAKSTSKLIDLTVCKCRVTDARYVKICPQCRRGHWKQAMP
jgi:hypothetical protein